MEKLKEKNKKIKKLETLIRGRVILSKYFSHFSLQLREVIFQRGGEKTYEGTT